MPLGGLVKSSVFQTIYGDRKSPSSWWPFPDAMVSWAAMCPGSSASYRLGAGVKPLPSHREDKHSKALYSGCTSS